MALAGLSPVPARIQARAEVGATPQTPVGALELEAVEIFTIAGMRGDGFERVNDRTSPVVEVVPTRTDGGKMRAGRIYLGSNSSDSRHQDVSAAKAKDGARLESRTGERIALKGKAR
jgi:hypothetical protein